MGRLISLVIGKRHLFDWLNALLMEGGKEARRMTNTGHRHHVSQCQYRASFTTANIYGITRIQVHRQLTSLRFTAIGNDRIHTFQTRSTLTHRACR